MRLIDADNLLDYIQYLVNGIESLESDEFTERDAGYDAALLDLYRHIKTKEPTIKPDVNHGHWIPDLIPTGVSAFGVDEMTAESEHCSVCGKDFWIGEKKDFCPNCGAKMDEEIDNAESDNKW